MVYGIGTDVVSKQRIKDMMARHQDTFFSRFLHPQEREFVMEQKNETKRIEKVAKFFSAKEAFSKAMGVGFRGHIHWNEIEITHTDLGQPIIQLHGNSLTYFNKTVGKKGSIHLSLADERDQVIAFTVVES